MLKKQTLTSQVTDHVLALINQGKVKPGERLPTEKELTARLQVSRTCIREAMKSLESLGLIAIRPKLGATVLRPSPAALFNSKVYTAAAYLQIADVLIEFRKIIEVGLASLAAEKAREEDFQAMEKALADHKHAIATDQKAYRADMEFHQAVAAATRNPIAMMTLEMISQPLAEQRRQTNEVPGAAEAGLRDHLKIYRAIRSHDAGKARAAMRSHMKTAEHYTRLVPKSTGSNNPKEKRSSTTSRTANARKGAETAK
jgi:GntR family transcriptional repressor for pyruvate dehydrogenase complex